MPSEYKKSWGDIRKYSSIFLISPALIFLIFFTISLFTLLVLSFYRYVPIKLWDPIFTYENYMNFLSDPFYLNYIWVTLSISAKCTIIALVISYPIAYYLARMKSKLLKGTLLTLVIISNFTNIVIRMYSWLFILQDGGIINSLLISFGLISEPIKLVYNELGVIIGMVHWVIPFTVFSLIGSIQNINPELELAAQSLGADKLITFLKITLPLSVPGIIAAVLLTFMGEITSFIIPMMMGGGRINFVSNLIYQKVIIASNFPFGGAASMILLAVTLVIGYWFNKFGKRVKVS